MIEAVIFDMDGLLIDSEPFWREAEKSSFSEVGLTLTDRMCENAMGLRINEAIEHWYSLFPWPDPDFKQIEKTILDRVARLIHSKGKLMSGVEQTLSFFMQRSIPMALASASPMSLIQAFLEQSGLRGAFTVIHSAESEPFGKPHPAVFLTAAEKLNIHPTRILVFEDSFNGMIAAKAARMKVIVVPDPAHCDQPRWVIADVRLASLDDWNEDFWNIINL